MEFDKQEHKDICMKMLDATNFPGQILDLAYEFKQAVLKAEVKTEPAPARGEQK